MHIPPPFPAELCITSHITEEQKQKQFAGCLWPQNDASRKQGESNTQESHSVSEPGPEVLHVVGKETLPRSVTGQCYGQRNLTSQRYRPMLWAKKPYLAALQANAMGKETLPRSVTGQCYGQRNLTSQRYRPMLWAKKPYLAALQANAMGKETLPRSVTGQCYGQRNLTSQRYRPMLWAKKPYLAVLQANAAYLALISCSLTTSEKQLCVSAFVPLVNS